MNELDQMIEELRRQEKELQFIAFTSDTALKIGLLLAEKARTEGLPIAIDITRHGHQLFHFGAEGSSPDNGQWIIRKNRVVNRFGISSLLVGALLQQSGKTIYEKYLLDPQEYAAHGGAFPIIIKNVGTVGTITVSGLPQKEDHNLVISAIRQYLAG